MKPVGKPDALIGHVRFDERGWETGRRLSVSARAHPRLYPEYRLSDADGVMVLSESSVRPAAIYLSASNSVVESHGCFSSEKSTLLCTLPLEQPAGLDWPTFSILY